MIVPRLTSYGGGLARKYAYRDGGESGFCLAPLHAVFLACRLGLSTIRAKMCAEAWHELVLFSMGPASALEADDWPVRSISVPLLSKDVS